MAELIAKKYGWQSEKAEKSHNYLLPASVNILKRLGVKNILDVGTGNGATIPTWISAGLKVSAMEPDEEGYSYSRQNREADVRKLGVGEPLPFEWNRAFDAIISLEVIEHLFDPVQFIHTGNQALKDRGFIIVSTPYHGYFKNLALAIAGKWDFHHHPSRTGGHIKFWSKQTLSELFVKNGYEQLSFSGVGRYPFLWKSMIMVFKKAS